MNIVATLLQAAGLFLVTNIDDIIVLSLFFARGAGQRGTTAKITAGQYLGFGAILAVAVAVIVENGGDTTSEVSGGRVAGPIARRIMEAVLRP